MVSQVADLPVALVSVDDFVAAVRVHADRVHDLVRRTGCPAQAAPDVVESTALDLLDRLVDAPESVGDLVGWWFAHAYDAARRVAAADPQAATRNGLHPVSLLAGTEAEVRVRELLAAMPERERLAVLLRDAYDLPLQSVAVALRRPDDVAAALIAASRLHLVSAYRGRRPPTLDGHPPRPAVDSATLAMLCDGSLTGQQATVLRRHTHTCAQCEDVADALSQARQLAAGLPVLSLPDDERDVLVERVEDRAIGVLPTLEEVLLVAESEDAVPPLVPAGVILLALFLAAVLGVAAGVVGHHARSQAQQLPGQVTSLGPEPSASVTATATTSATSSAEPSTSPVAVVENTPPPPSSTPSSSAPASAAPASAALAIDPSSGPNGSTITASGQGWRPGHVVHLTYVNSLGQIGSTTVVAPGADGSFTVRISAYDPSGLPGPHTVRAYDGESSDETVFTATT